MKKNEDRLRSNASKPVTSSSCRSESKCLFCGWIMDHLNEHNKKMHHDNCKLNKNKRDYRNLDKECIFCNISYKKLKNLEIKTHFNACKLKNLESVKKTIVLSGSSNAVSDQSNYEGKCIFCTKLISSLNDYNKNKHISACQIKSFKQNNANFSKNSF